MYFTLSSSTDGVGCFNPCKTPGSGAYVSKASLLYIWWIMAFGLRQPSSPVVGWCMQLNGTVVCALKNILIIIESQNC